MYILFTMRMRNQNLLNKRLHAFCRAPATFSEYPAFTGETHVAISNGILTHDPRTGAERGLGVPSCTIGRQKPSRFLIPGTSQDRSLILDMSYATRPLTTGFVVRVYLLDDPSCCFPTVPFSGSPQTLKPAHHVAIGVQNLTVVRTMTAGSHTGRQPGSVISEAPPLKKR